MQIIDCQFGTLIIPIIIKILVPANKKAFALHAKTLVWELNGSFSIKGKEKIKSGYSKVNWNKYVIPRKEESRGGSLGVAFTF